MASNKILKEGEYDFVDEVPEKLTCNICTNVLRDPRLTECCGQHFCQECLQSWFQQHKKITCPHCREEDFVHIRDKSIKREINQLQVYCSKREEGCMWVGEVCSLETHLRSETGCDYVMVSCPNGCKKLTFRVLPTLLHQQTANASRLANRWDSYITSSTIESVCNSSPSSLSPSLL